ncbi:Gfo/Idh/MocA family oxidoreductase [Oceanobacillus profundus]|uniref:Gfo/Idh/MocA family protein n=1 Tax=Oceanobacillus profundus TaxID=372463 RepID=UPI0020420B31|nr:Gfo/Idh/MocA family oxidoreductase [Oceanobacillus profundus]MCM3399532.1 Gfo/Idh/MocA family oxidoreductase [Oceanobacillus profundus]
MKKGVHWGILSTAKIAQDQMLPAFMKAEKATVKAIASSNERVNDVSEKFGIQKVYSTYEELLDDPEIDAVYIPLPNKYHCEWVEKAAKKGKHILCEKPAALTVTETQKMIDICKENNVIFLEGFMYQFHPQHERVKEIIASGEIGEVKTMRASFSFLLEELDGNIRTNPTLGGGSLYDVGCYCLHSIGNILDLEVEKIFASCKMHPEFNVDLSIEGIIKLNNNVTALFDASMERTSRQYYELIGTNGTIEVPRAYLPNLYDGEGIINVSTNGKVRKEKIVGNQYALQIEHFSKWVLEKSFTHKYSKRTIENMQSIEICFQSIQAGTFINKRDIQMKNEIEI